MTAKIRGPVLVLILILLTTGASSFADPQGAVPARRAEFYSGNPRLEDFLREALERNPSVREGSERYEAALERLPQAGSLPDPMVNLTQYVRTPETRVGPQTTMVSISQQIPWFGKLGDKEKVAAKEAAIQKEQFDVRRAEVVRQVKLAYYDLAYTDRAISITEEDLAVLRHYETLAQARYSQGVGLQQAVVKLQAEITRDLNRLQVLRSRRVDAEAALNTLMDRPAERSIPELAEPARPKAEIRLEELYRRGQDNRPELQAALLQIERDEARIDLARRNFWPDFTIGATMTNVLARSDPAGLLNPPDQNGKNIYGFTVGVNIPLRRRKYDAALIEATQDKLGSAEGYRAVLNQVESSVRALGFRIQTLDEQIALYEKTLLPQAEQALRSTEAAYSTGTLGVLDLLDSERVLLDVRLGLAQMNSDYLKTLTDMERAIGSRFPEVNP